VRPALHAAALAAILASSLPAFAQEHGEEHGTGDQAAPSGQHGETAGERGETAGHGHHVEPFNIADFGAEHTIPLLAMLLNFGALLALLVWLGKKPLMAFLQARHLAIRDALADAQRTRAEAEARFEEYSSRLDHLDKELARLREEMTNVAQAERERIVADAEERAARLGREAEFLLGQELKQVRKDLERDLAIAAVAAAEEVLRRVTTGDDQARLAETYLEALGKDAKSGKQGSA
jgi:F-type H+-transporting ATPase subunit b